MSGTNLSSGLQTADAIIKTGRSILAGVNIITNATADVTIVIYDNTAASGTVLYKRVVTGTLDSVYDNLGDNGVRGKNGLYVDVTGAGAAYIVHYR